MRACQPDLRASGKEKTTHCLWMRLAVIEGDLGVPVSARTPVLCRMTTRQVVTSTHPNRQLARQVVAGM
jgi:hypothetical protein